MAAQRNRALLPVLETERLVLRAPSLQDLPVWTKICQDSFGDSTEEAWTQFSYYTAGWLLHGHGLFTVVHRADDTVIGFVILGLEWGDQEPELGYLFDASFHNQGFASEAVTAVREFGFELLGSGQFVSYVGLKNTRSQALAERVGSMRDARAEASFGDPIYVYRHISAEVSG